MKQFTRQDTPHFSYIGNGQPGGKAAGLLQVEQLIDQHFANGFKEIAVNIPASTVLLSDVFEDFMNQNNLWDIAFSNLPNETIARYFIEADLPVAYTGDLLALATANTKPLAVRSSSLLEDSQNEPFAGVYTTKMLANNLTDPYKRFDKLRQAVKFVWASLYFKGSKDYFAASGQDIAQERMAVLIQQVAGSQRGQRFYPCLSGVARSYNFYPSGYAAPQDGVASLALGLGKTIVDGSECWTYCPRYPASPPPYSEKDLLKYTQSKFWAVNLGQNISYDPASEVEYLCHNNLRDAEDDNALCVVGRELGQSRGRTSWVIDFSKLLKWDSLPFNELLNKVMHICEEAMQAKVEIEFALDIAPNNGKATFTLLQVRTMAVSGRPVDFELNSYPRKSVLCYSPLCMGNGVNTKVKDIVFVNPQSFELNATLQIAKEIQDINSKLTASGVPYLLVVFGRLGTSDPWLGIPVEYPGVSGARAIVEATLPGLNPELSQGSHFFHNINSRGIYYFCVEEAKGGILNWDWLNSQPVAWASSHVTRVHLQNPLALMVDGRTRRGIILL